MAFTFAEETNDMTPIQILNFYRNSYYAESSGTERSIVANAINDFFGEVKFLIQNTATETAEYDEKKYYLCGTCIYDEDMNLVMADAKNGFADLRKITTLENVLKNSMVHYNIKDITVIEGMSIRYTGPLTGFTCKCDPRMIEERDKLLQMQVVSKTVHNDALFVFLEGPEKQDGTEDESDGECNNSNNSTSDHGISDNLHVTQ